MSPTYVEKLGLKTRKTNVKAQKINGSALKTFAMVITDFQVEDKGGRPRFFQETFLVADIKFEMILGMLFLKLSNPDVSFSERTFMWKFYTTNKVLSTTKQVQLIELQEFVIAALDVNRKTFIIHVAIREQEEMAVDLDKKAQIKAQIKAQNKVQGRVQSKAQSGV